MIYSGFGYFKGYNCIVLTFVIIISLQISGLDGGNNSSDAVLSRTKRYLAFPEGSSFSVSICWTIGVIGNPNVNFLSFGLNWGVSYELPNETWVIEHSHAFKHKLYDESSPAVGRKARHLLYGELEAALNSMGYGGRHCILRALCESRKFLGKKKYTMEETLLKTIFSLPFEKAFLRDHRSTHEYHQAYHENEENSDCSSTFSNCGFSLIALAFGKHSKRYSFM